MISADFTKLPGKRRVLQLHCGRWTLGIASQYEGDRYGFRGSDCWSVCFTVVRNPRGR